MKTRKITSNHKQLRYDRSDALNTPNDAALIDGDKLCRLCCQSLPKCQFRLHYEPEYRKYRLRPYCNSCLPIVEKKRSHEYYLRHKEQITARVRAYGSTHREEVASRNRQKHELLMLSPERREAARIASQERRKANPPAAREKALTRRSGMSRGES